MKSRLTVLAIGGNSLIKDKDHIALSFQYEAVKETAKYIADLVANSLGLVITHGNGPQVGFLYRRGELAQTRTASDPVGYMWCRHPRGYWVYDRKGPFERISEKRN